MRAAFLVAVLIVLAAAGGLVYAATAEEPFVELDGAEAAEVERTLVPVAERDRQFLGGLDADCTVRVVGADRAPSGSAPMQVYADVSCSGSAAGGDEEAVNAGIDVPARFTMTGPLGRQRVTQVELPVDGEGYGDSLEQLFPKGARDLLDGGVGGG